jgi:cytochrome c biogenesis protein CcdA
MSYISQAAGERNDKRTTLPTLAFAAGLAAVFCTLGITAAQLGGVLGSTATATENGGSGNDTALNIMALLSNAIVVLMGLQLLELIRVPLPTLDGVRQFLNPSISGSTSSSMTLTNGIAQQNQQPVLLNAKGEILTDTTTTQKQEQGSLFRTFLLGGSSALVASPCATPVLTSILAFCAKTQNPILGATLLFGYTLGYSTPLLLLASTGGQALVNIKQAAGKSNSDTTLYAKIAPWVSPFTAGILLWYGTNGVLTAIFGDPSLAGLMILE